MTSISYLLTCWLSSVRLRSVSITSSALAASIRPALNAETLTHATEYAKTCTHTPHVKVSENFVRHSVFSLHPTLAVKRLHLGQLQTKLICVTLFICSTRSRRHVFTAYTSRICSSRTVKIIRCTILVLRGHRSKFTHHHQAQSFNSSCSRNCL